MTSTVQRSLLALASVLGLSTGLGATPVGQAAPASHAVAAPRPCDSWTDVALPEGDVARLPSAGRNSGLLSCTFVHGMSGAGVYTLQDALNRCYGAGLAVNGAFGTETEAALRNVQRIHRLPVDGVYGPVLRRTMYWPVYNADGSFDRCAPIGR